jgi:hypothetical protein
VGIGAQLSHRATVQRATHAPDAYGQRVATWRVVAEDVPCRLVQREVRAPLGALAEQPIIIVTTILFAPGVDVRETDRIVDVDFGDGTTDAGPFVVRTLAQRRFANRGVVHQAANVERIGR